MNKLFAAVAITFALMTGGAQAAVENGKAAPDFKFNDIKGAEHSLSEFKGKTVVLEWTNPGCPFVKKFYDAKAMQKTQADAVKDGVVWVSINSSAKGKEGHFASNEEAAKWVAEHGSNASFYTLDESGTIGKQYGAKTTPHMFVINKDGVLVYQGAIDSIKSADADDIAKADNYVVDALKAIKEGKAPAKASAEPYGCGVKYAE